MKHTSKAIMVVKYTLFSILLKNKHEAENANSLLVKHLAFMFSSLKSTVNKPC